MDLYEVMRTTFAAREFTDEPLPDDDLRRILDNARFAPSGGNRQGWTVIVVSDRETRRRLAELSRPALQRYVAQLRAGENPWNPFEPPSVTAEEIAAVQLDWPLLDTLPTAPALLVVCIDLRVVAAMDQDLPRVGIIGGASIYPFVWNILLAARNEGYGGTITTFLTAQEPAVRDLLGLPDHVAVAAMLPLGRPVKQLTKLSRKEVVEFTRRERWDGAAF
ncbi:MAG: nitroreductase [Acidobacteria bacterium]|nr:MAG: nitroreductase [Acidobacteriota bacterium]REK11311.1 MAG: nitroreductase [Acidobacteriota bacterium]